MKILSVIFGLALILPQIVYGGGHCKTERSLSFAQQLAKLEPKFDIEIIDMKLFQTGNFVAGYEYEVDSAYTKGLYSRADSWQIAIGAKPEKKRTIGEGFESVGKGNIGTHAEAKFIRFFKDPCLAMKAVPYSPRRIPLKTETALSPKFQVGDYFQFRANVGVVLSGELLNMIGTSFWGASLNLSYLMQGFYQLHIVKLDQKKIRLKVIAHRGSTKEASVGIGFEQEFDVFGWNAVNNALERFVNTNPIKIKVDQKKADVVLIDYILDLTDPEVAAAYEDILPRTKDIKNLSKLEVYRGLTNLESNILLDLSPLENLYRKDYEASTIGRIRRNLKTNSSQTLNEFGFKVGNKILGLGHDNRTSTGLMALRKPNDEFERFLLKSWETVSEQRFFVSFYRNKHEEAFRALFTANDGYTSLRPVNIVKHIDMKKSAINFRTYNDLKARLYRILPDEVYHRIPWRNWTQTAKTKFDNFGLRFEFAITPELIDNLPAMKAPEIISRYRRYLFSKNLSGTEFISMIENDFQTKETVFEDYLKKLGNQLEKALDQSKSSVERVSYVAELRSNPIFEDPGLGFLASLDQKNITNWSHLNLDISSNQALIEYSYGKNEMTEVYKKILLIKSALDDDALDPLLEAESISMPKAM